MDLVIVFEVLHQLVFVVVFELRIIVLREILFGILSG